MNFGEAFGATFREVGKSEHDGKPTRIVRASRTYPTNQTDLWNALTEKERIRRWFGEVSGDFELGGRFSIKDNADSEITACEPPKSLALTWEFDDNISWVRVAVAESNDGALLTLEHEMPTDEKSEAHWQQYGPAGTGVGWEMAFLGLDVYLADDSHSSHEAGEAWAQTEQGKTTLRAWAQAWGEAHVRSGASTRIAKDLADQTAAFYTGED
jgi:uncharacterized protein YndB with AHSA1/START domain